MRRERICTEITNPLEIYDDFGGLVYIKSITIIIIISHPVSAELFAE
jgi:hypothetical protein